MPTHDSRLLWTKRDKSSPHKDKNKFIASVRRAFLEREQKISQSAKKKLQRK
jgi:hypothetical protein